MKELKKQTNNRLILPLAIIALTFLITITRGIRWPNYFSKAHWLIDYRYGFTKRGLIGSLCSVLTRVVTIPTSPGLIEVLSVLFLFLMFGTMFYLIIRIARRSRNKQIKRNTLALGLVFASSPFVVMNAHCLGYFDALLFFLAIASVMLIFRQHPVWAALLSSAAILIHESYLLIGINHVFLASVEMMRANSDRRTNRKIRLVPLLLPIIVFLALIIYQYFSQNTNTIRAYLNVRLNMFFGFPVTRIEPVSLWHTTPLKELFFEEHVVILERLLDPFIFRSVYPTLLTCLLTILVYIYSTFRIKFFSFFSVILQTLIYAPMAMHLVAWDTARISIFLIGNGFIAYWILTETREAHRTHYFFSLLALVTLISNIYVNAPLMDDEIDRFSIPLRFLLYSPAIAFVTHAMITNMKDDWSKANKEEATPENLSKLG